MGSPVSILSVKESTSDLKDSIMQSLTLIDFKWKSKVNSVIIKPNLCYYWHPSTGQTTDPRIVRAIIDIVRDRYPSTNISIAEADASAMRTKHAFPVLGYTRLSEEKKVGLINLSEDILEDRTMVVNGKELSFQVPQSLLRSDLFINIPKLKVMRHTTITCAMKNIFGCIGTPRKVKYHSFLNESIVGMNKILHPDLTIVDGLVALGLYPKRLNLLLAGTETFSVDCAVCKLMGYKPRNVEFLKIAQTEGLGSYDQLSLKGITDIASYQKIFPRPDFKSSNWFLGIQFSLIRAYKKISGDIIPPALDE